MRRVVAAAALLALTGLSACSSSAHGEPGALRVVASTNVWSDVVGQLAGRLAGSKVVITSFIDATTDPHAYEASTRDQLAISKADLIIENGGGYDDFMDTLRRSAGGSATTLNAVGLSGHGSANEHVWYDFRTVQLVADRITAFLIAARPRLTPRRTARTPPASPLSWDASARTSSGSTASTRVTGSPSPSRCRCTC